MSHYSKPFLTKKTILPTAWVLVIWVMCLPHQPALAQYAKTKTGVTLGYELVRANHWDGHINFFNAVKNPPFLEDGQPLITDSRSFGGWYSHNVMSGIVITPEVLYSWASSKTENNGNPFEIRTNFLELSVNGQFYGLKFIPTRALSHIKENFFVQASIGAGLFMPNIVQGGMLGEGEFAPDTAVSVSGGTMFRLGIGTGYHFYLSDRISLTPLLRLETTPSVPFNGFGGTINNLTAPAETTHPDNGGLARTSFHLKIGYVLKPQLPRCPIASCQVHMEHRHRQFGDQVFRGNPYSRRQNPRYGEKHRGEAMEPTEVGGGRKGKRGGKRGG